ncbi:hypothetical protein B0H10DRAFT_1939673 [Mycena sp. CBHHK59/15]|nr:hypothetical protein B0H10DRAFT_1939673 [Mycena sp. CBHHK59/15]
MFNPSAIPLCPALHVYGLQHHLCQVSRDFKLDSSPFQNLSRLQVQKLSFKHLNIFVIQDLKISNLSRRSARPVDDASSTGHLPTTKLLCIFTTQIRVTSGIWIFVPSNCIPGLGTVIWLQLVLPTDVPWNLGCIGSNILHGLSQDESHLTSLSQDTQRQYVFGQGLGDTDGKVVEEDGKAVADSSRVPPMNTPPSPASGASTCILEAILPALSLAKASVTGIGIPGVEPVINGVLELVTMISTMKANKEDLSKLERSLKAFTAIDVPGASEDLKHRLGMLSSWVLHAQYWQSVIDNLIAAFRNFTAIAVECKSLAEKSRWKRYLKSKDDKDKIVNIQNSVAFHIQESTFCGNISIEKLVGDMVSKVGVVHANEILARVTCVPACYNAENTPKKCMDGTQVNIIDDIVTQLTSPPDLSRRLFMLSGSAGSDHKEIKLLPSTIARQLADYNADFRHLLVKFLDGDCTGILTAEPCLQFQQLVVELLVQMPPSPTPWIICLDALDECGKETADRFSSSGCWTASLTCQHMFDSF